MVTWNKKSISERIRTGRWVCEVRNWDIGGDSNKEKGKKSLYITKKVIYLYIAE